MSKGFGFRRQGVYQAPGSNRNKRALNFERVFLRAFSSNWFRNDFLGQSVEGPLRLCMGFRKVVNPLGDSARIPLF